MDEPLIRYKNVNINQQELGVLEDVNLELNKGEFVYLIGKVGSGKTSLLKTIYGELDIQSGDAEVLGYNMSNIKRKHIPQLRRRLGIVFQDFQLLTDRNVHSNLSFVLRATGWSNKIAIKERIDEVLDQVGMTGKGYKMPNELSGGEQQRIVIARAILNRPEIILADEPTGNLDSETGRQIVELLKSICASGSAIMMTTHNLHLLSEYPGIVYRFENHQIKEVTTPTNRYITRINPKVFHQFPFTIAIDSEIIFPSPLSLNISKYDPKVNEIPIYIPGTNKNKKPIKTTKPQKTDHTRYTPNFLNMTLKTSIIVIRSSIPA